jgi:hypothetical protein
MSINISHTAVGKRRERRVFESLIEGNRKRGGGGSDQTQSRGTGAGRGSAAGLVTAVVRIEAGGNNGLGV